VSLLNQRKGTSLNKPMLARNRSATSMNRSTMITRTHILFKTADQLMVIIMVIIIVIITVTITS
jgi:hypothetical protein